MSSEARLLHAAGVKLFVVAVGDDRYFDQVELSNMASAPNSDHLLYQENFPQLLSPSTLGFTVNTIRTFGLVSSATTQTPALPNDTTSNFYQ